MEIEEKVIKVDGVEYTIKMDPIRGHIVWLKRCRNVIAVSDGDQVDFSGMDGCIPVQVLIPFTEMVQRAYSNIKKEEK